MHNILQYNDYLKVIKVLIFFFLNKKEIKINKKFNFMKTVKLMERGKKIIFVSRPPIRSHLSNLPQSQGLSHVVTPPPHPYSLIWLSSDNDKIFWFTACAKILAVGAAKFWRINAGARKGKMAFMCSRRHRHFSIFFISLFCLF